MKENNLGIVGSGCLATHLKHYLDMESVPYTCWSRSQDKCSPYSKLKGCKHIILLISDNSISEFILNNPKLQKLNLVHCSGSLTIEEAAGIHPLMTFSKELYSLEEYRNVPFIGEKGRIGLKTIIPQLRNQYYELPSDKRSIYHALCVISGNFTNILWNKTIRDFQNKLNLPREVLYPYLERTVLNIQKSPLDSLTGPIRREDKTTIKNNKRALQSPLWSKIYSLFNKVYQKEIK